MKNSFARKNARRIVALGNFTVMSFEEFYADRGIFVDEAQPEYAKMAYESYLERKSEEKAALKARIR